MRLGFVQNRLDLTTTPENAELILSDEKQSSHTYPSSPCITPHRKATCRVSKTASCEAFPLCNQVPHKTYPSLDGIKLMQPHARIFRGPLPQIHSLHVQQDQMKTSKRHEQETCTACASEATPKRRTRLSHIKRRGLAAAPRGLVGHTGHKIAVRVLLSTL